MCTEIASFFKNWKRNKTAFQIITFIPRKSKRVNAKINKTNNKTNKINEKVILLYFIILVKDIKIILEQMERHPLL